MGRPQLQWHSGWWRTGNYQCRGSNFTTQQAPVQSVVSDAHGKYSFDNVPAAQYELEFVAGSAYLPTRVQQGSAAVDSDIQSNGLNRTDHICKTRLSKQRLMPASIALDPLVILRATSTMTVNNLLKNRAPRIVPLSFE